MKCNIEWLSAYLDGALAEEKRAKLEEHLKTCEFCTAKLEEFARVEQAAKKIPAPQLSEAYWENFASRVQNKLTIREKQKTSPAWLEVLKSFFQPTPGKLAIAGGAAVILLLTFVSLKQWRTQTFRPPVFEAEKPVAQAKADSVQTAAKGESVFRAVEKDNKAGLGEKKRLIQPAREGGMAAFSQKPAENAPAAAAPFGRMLAAPAEQKSKEEPSLAASVERDESVKGDTITTVAGKKAEIRKEVPTSQVKVSPEEIAKLPIRNVEDFLRVKGGVTKNGLRVKGGVTKKESKDTWSLDRSDLIVVFREAIAEKENELKKDITKYRAETLYISLSDCYRCLYRITCDSGDWRKANKRVNEFLKADISDSTRQWLLQIQSELKKLKK